MFPLKRSPLEAPNREVEAEVWPCRGSPGGEAGPLPRAHSHAARREIRPSGVEKRDALGDVEADDELLPE